MSIYQKIMTFKLMLHILNYCTSINERLLTASNRSYVYKGIDQ